MLTTLLSAALLVFTPRPGDHGTLTLTVPILPGGEMAQALVVCSTGQLVGWWLKSGLFYEPRPARYMDQYSFQVRNKVRQGCDRIWPRN